MITTTKQRKRVPEPHVMPAAAMIRATEQASAMVGLLAAAEDRDAKRSQRPPASEKAPETRRSKKNIDVGRRIAEARALKGHTQEYLARLLGVTTSAVGQWEIGMTMPSTENFAMLARDLDTSVEYLRTGDDSRDTHRAKTPLEAEILKMLRQMDVSDQVDIFQVAKRKVAAIARGKGGDGE